MKNWKDILVLPQTAILDTMHVIDQAGNQIAIVTDEERRLLGTVTDGDIRRGILKGIPLQDPIHKVMNRQPMVLSKDDSRHKFIALFRRKKLRQIPVVNEKHQVVDVKFADDFFNVESKDNWIVLMAGGLGTRLKPLTNDVPKPMLTVGDKPILETILESFIEYGFQQFFFSVNYKKEIIKDYFGDGSRWGVAIRYLDEKKRLGTAGALSLLPKGVDKPLIVMNGDILTKVNFEQLLDFHEETHSRATMCVRDYYYQIPYGVVKTEGSRLVVIEEKPKQRYFVNAGIYVLSPDVLTYIPKNEYYDMPALFETLTEKKIHANVFPIREYWMDIGRMGDFERANSEFTEVFG